MQKKLYEILVPAGTEEGNELPLGYHKEWDDYVTSLCGGLTILRSTKGRWIDHRDGQEFSEKMIPVRVYCTRDQLDEIIDFTMEHYVQRAVLAYCVSEEVILRHKDDQ